MSQNSLPVFANPPVVEVALSVAFENIDGYSSARAGRLWSRYPEYPQTEDHPELDVAFEESGGPTAAQGGPRLMFEQVPRVRTWFLSSDGTRLIQVQRNRFIYNWRRAETQLQYPSYATVRAEFVRTFGLFAEFLASENLGRPKATQCDLTYVNQIERGAQSHRRLGQVIRLWNDRDNQDGFLPGPSDARFTARYAIPQDDERELLGRLTVTLQPAFLKKTGAELLTLTMLARGRPLPPDLDGAMRFLDIGHEWIVRGFKELTTPDMHQQWGLQR